MNQDLMKLVMRHAELQGFLAMQERRKQIIQDSMRIIETTKNVKVLIGRVDTIVEHYNWFIYQRDEKDMPVTIECSPDFTNKLYTLQNERILEIASSGALELYYSKKIEKQ